MLNYKPRFAFGLPLDWVSEQDVELYSGRAVDIHGAPILPEFQRRPFHGRAIDPDDPPVFESQAAYLERHGLLTAAERARLAADDYAHEEISG